MRVQHLIAAHDLSGFSCGNKALDDWLRVHGLENDDRDLSRTFVLVDDGGTVVGYYSLTMGGVIREQLPKRYGKRLPSFTIGMVLIGRLAVAADQQGHGYGRDLMIDAIKAAARAGQHAAARFIAVDPIDEAAQSFCIKFGFKPVPGDPVGRMFLRLSDALRLTDL